MNVTKVGPPKTPFCKTHIFKRGSNGRNLRLCVVAGKKSNEFSEGVKKMEKIFASLKELRSELIDVAKVEEKIADASRETGSGGRLEEIFSQLLDRQEKFFREEREFWINERAEWKRQEKELREEIARLQQLVIGQPQTGGTESEAHLAVDKTASEKAEQPLPAEEKKYAPKPTASQSVAAAISAVDKEDVLSNDYENILKKYINGGTINSDQISDSLQEPVETVKSPPEGPPPSLSIGDDDIYWVNKLQEALLEKGYFCGDDDAEDFFFGEGTQSALLTFQSCAGLEETGTADEATWTKLGHKFTSDVPSSDSKDASDLRKEKKESAEEELKEFPVLSENDGGKEVHYLQVLLEIRGYSCGTDDMQWWHYGDETIAAVKTFQACNGLPQSGVADSKTWTALADGWSVSDVVKKVRNQSIFEEDLTKGDRVWLLGEQRWERRIR